MILSVWNKKGGVGKTSLAYSLAKDLDFNLISNDDSAIEECYDRAEITDKVTIKDDSVYDFGGFTDPKMEEVIKNSGAVIVPTIPSENANIKTYQTVVLDLIEKMEIPAGKIIIVVMKGDDAALKLYKDLFEEHNCSIILMPGSRIFDKQFEECKSILGIADANPLARYTYRRVLDAYNTLLDTIIEKTNQ